MKEHLKAASATIGVLLGILLGCIFPKVAAIITIIGYGFLLLFLIYTIFLAMFS